MKKIALLLALFFPFILLAQDCSKVSKKTIKRLQTDINKLASDQMEGREPGTAGEIKARDFIIGRMQEIGLTPKGTESFIQAFSYFEKVKQKPNKTKLSLNNKKLKLNHQFYPINLSSNGQIEDVPVISVGYGIHMPDQGYSDYERLDADVNGYIAFMDISSPKDLNAKAPDLSSRATEALDRGALAILLYNSDKGTQVPSPSFNRIKKIGIPVAYIKASAFTNVPIEFVENASLSVTEYEVPTQAHNIIGFLDNSAERTVAIMAHYDHLGYGGEASKYRGPRKIHNGADDNASGTAALLELAYFLKKNKLKEKNNFLFIAFSAEEKGLLGSRYYVMNPTLDLNNINYVLNMDMIGRMETNMPLTIEGIGSSLIWESSLKELECEAFPLTLKKREDGPSDHAAFYYAGIPSLHFWTGKHDDYHKPSDDAEKINFEAESQIISFMESFILLMDSKGKIDFYLREK
ncbi:MAG: M28 family peptidase [Flavobacteriales bacterium]|nr:M28 family peptidase [Flavobacteriales bacterium]